MDKSSDITVAYTLTCALVVHLASANTAEQDEAFSIAPCLNEFLWCGFGLVTRSVSL